MAWPTAQGELTAGIYRAYSGPLQSTMKGLPSKSGSSDGYCPGDFGDTRARRKLCVELAGKRDDPTLRRLLRNNPMDGRIQITLEREPDFFLAAAIEGDQHFTVVARDEASGEIVAMGSRSVRTAFVNGHPARLGYLSQLRVDRTARRKFLRLLPEGYELLRQTHSAIDTPFDITTIIADNSTARRLLEAGLPGLPHYHRLEEFVAFIIPVRQPFLRSEAAARITSGSPSLQSGILACLEHFGRRHQFTPRWTANDLSRPGLGPHNFHVALEGDQVIGCLALWDQRGFKQAVVHGYDKTLGRWRPLLNLFGARLPKVGSTLSLAYLSHVAVDEDNPRVLATLLAAAMADAQRARLDHVTIGFAARHPLVEVVRRHYRCREYVSNLYAVYWDKLPALDSRIPHPEVAIL